MSVNSVSIRLPSSYSLPSGNSSQKAKSTAFAKELPGRSFPAAGSSQATSADPTDVPFQSAFEQAWREDATTAKEGASDTPGGRSSPGIALYQRVSQYADNEASTSALLKSWNDIVQGQKDSDSAAAAFVKTLSRSEMAGAGLGVLDLTA